MSPRFSTAARQDLAAAVAWYLMEGGGPDVACAFESALSGAIGLLAKMPRLGTITYPGVRAWPLRRFPYTLLYRADDDDIVVIAVAHQSRRPGYWAGR